MSAEPKTVAKWPAQKARGFCLNRGLLFNFHGRLPVNHDYYEPGARWDVASQGMGSMGFQYPMPLSRGLTRAPRDLNPT